MTGHWNLKSTYPCVNDLLKVDTDGATVDVEMILAVVDKSTDLLQANFARTVTKHKQHRVDNIRFPASIWTNYGCEALKKQMEVDCIGFRLIESIRKFYS